MNKDDLAELNYLRKRVGILQWENKELRLENAHKYRQGYEQGWKDATRKIKNFIIKHCEKFEKPDIIE